MSKRRKHLKRNSGIQIAEKKQVVLATKKVIVITVAVMVIVVIILIFDVGSAYWGNFLIEHRRFFIGILLLLVLSLSLISPLIVEANSNPRPLSGPGKNPKLHINDMFQ